MVIYENLNTEAEEAKSEDYKAEKGEGKTEEGGRRE